MIMKEDEAVKMAMAVAVAVADAAARKDRKLEGFDLENVATMAPSSPSSSSSS